MPALGVCPVLSLFLASIVASVGSNMPPIQGCHGGRLALIQRAFPVPRRLAHRGVSTVAAGVRRQAVTAKLDERVSLAPMMEYTDRHFRFLLRQLSSRMVLYTEMVAANTLAYNEESRHRFLCFNDPVEHPVVLQLGGADASKLAEACAIADPYKYDAINLNCGCPSSRVAGSGCFGAALMREPEHVGDLCRAMSESTSSPITVKHRIGVDDQESYEELARFVEVVASRAPVKHFIVHARKALLNGISPEANRRIPPLKYDYVYRLVKEFPELDFTLNGGVLSYDDIETHLSQGVAGVMIGRAITSRPFYWSDVDQRIYGLADDEAPRVSRREVLERYTDYAEQEEQAAGTGIRIRRLLCKHLQHLFAGEPNGKRFRTMMDQELLRPDSNIRQVIENSAKVISDEVLDARPSSYDVAAPEAVRN